MSPYIKITGRTFTMWLLASGINALLCGIGLSLIKPFYGEAAGDIILIFIVSLFFSAPGFFVFWIVLLFKIATHTTERALFRSALITAFILACATAYFGARIFSGEFYNHASIPATCVIISSLSSILLHFKHFKKIK